MLNLDIAVLRSIFLYTFVDFELLSHILPSGGKLSIVGVAVVDTTALIHLPSGQEYLLAQVEYTSFYYAMST